MVDAYTVGTPIIFNKFFSGPQHLEAEKVDILSSNNLVLEDENLTLQMFNYLQRLLAPLKKILASSWTLREGTRLLVCLKTVDKLEGIVIEKLFFFSCYLTSIQDNLSLTNVCMKLHKAKILLFIKALLLYLYLHLVIFYEEKGNFTFNILRRKITSYYEHRIYASD